MSESFHGDGQARTDEQRGADAGVRAPEAREPTNGVQGSEESVTGGVRGPAQAPPYPPTCRPEFTTPAAGEQDEFLDEQVADFQEPAVENGAVPVPRLTGRGVRKKRAAAGSLPVVPPRVAPENLSPEQRLLLLDTWQRSKLPAGDFAAMVGVSKHTLYTWKWKFEEQGPGGLVDRPRGGPKGSKLPELTKRTILMLKQANPDWGCQRISDMLVRGPGLAASASTVARILVEAGYELHEEPTRPHPDKVRSF